MEYSYREMAEISGKVFSEIAIGDWVMWRRYSHEDSNEVWDVAQVTDLEICGENHVISVKHPGLLSFNFDYYYGYGLVKVIKSFKVF